MAEIIDYGRFRERLDAVMPRWEEAERMSPEGFQEHLADTGPRWELLREFQEGWGYVPSGGRRRPRGQESGHRAYVRELMAEHGGRSAEDEPVSDLPVPRALEEWWELPFNSFVDRPDLYETNPEWPPTERPDPSGYGIAGGLSAADFPFAEQDPRVCVFMAENQYCNEWGYAAVDAAAADPVVLTTAGDEQGTEAWSRQSRSVCEFFLQLAAVRLPAWSGWSVEADELSPEAEKRLTAALPPMGFLPWRELGARIHLLGGPDVIVFHDEGLGDFEWQIYGRTPQALERLGRTLGLDWAGEIREPYGARG